MYELQLRPFKCQIKKLLQTFMIRIDCSFFISLNQIMKFKSSSHNTSYYIDRCELWGFIREINSDISHVKYQFFSRRNYIVLLYNYKCGGYIPCSVTVNTHTEKILQNVIDDFGT